MRLLNSHPFLTSHIANPRVSRPVQHKHWKKNWDLGSNVIYSFSIRIIYLTLRRASVSYLQLLLWRKLLLSRFSLETWNFRTSRSNITLASTWFLPIGTWTLGEVLIRKLNFGQELDAYSWFYLKEFFQIRFLFNKTKKWFETSWNSIAEFWIYRCRNSATSPLLQRRLSET